MLQKKDFKEPEEGDYEPIMRVNANTLPDNKVGEAVEFARQRSEVTTEFLNRLGEVNKKLAATREG